MVVLVETDAEGLLMEAAEECLVMASVPEVVSRVLEDSLVDGMPKALPIVG